MKLYRKESGHCNTLKKKRVTLSHVNLFFTQMLRALQLLSKGNMDTRERERAFYFWNASYILFWIGRQRVGIYRNFFSLKISSEKEKTADIRGIIYSFRKKILLKVLFSIFQSGKMQFSTRRKIFHQRLKRQVVRSDKNNYNY